MSSQSHQGDFETIIGLEIHVQLQTDTKLFCGCANRFGGAPNSRTCPVCLGMPGALPVLNAKAVRCAARAALALGCSINLRSRFARKNYFYPDLPKGYQISQYDQPLAEHGLFAFDLEGERRQVCITRLHLEEDAGKSIHTGMPRSPDSTYIDLNRCGVPLAEIITEPDLRTPEQADAFLSGLRNTLLYLGVTDANMEEGSLRCDANISVRRRGQTELNPKTELKNLNSFRFMRQALRHEVERQAAELVAGRPLVQCTRLFDERSATTVEMRSKEDAHDYRYFPDPDLVPIVLDEATVAELDDALPELPLARLERLVSDLAIPHDDAAVLVEDAARGDYFEALVAAGARPATASNWVRIEVGRWLNEQGRGIVDFPVSAVDLAALLQIVADGGVAAGLAGKVMQRMAETGAAAADIIADEGMEQISASQELGPVVDEVLEEHPDEVAGFRAGGQQVLGFLMGQVMRATQGKANPELTEQLLRARLEE